MKTNEQIKEMVREQFVSMQESLNEVEDMVVDIEMNQNPIAWRFGKIYENFKNIVALMEVNLEQ
tara:strand:+ start:251 stop:442 length:192 start_codon:yes stop_codon:yes gene_type:complete